MSEVRPPSPVQDDDPYLAAISIARYVLREDPDSLAAVLPSSLGEYWQEVIRSLAVMADAFATNCAESHDSIPAELLLEDLRRRRLGIGDDTA